MKTDRQTGTERPQGWSRAPWCWEEAAGPTWCSSLTEQGPTAPSHGGKKLLCTSGVCTCAWIGLARCSALVEEGALPKSQRAFTRGIG